MNTLKIVISICCLIFPALAMASENDVMASENNVMTSENDKAEYILCSVTNVIECRAGMDCLESSAEEIKIPQFIKVDLDEKKMSDAKAKDSTKSTSIKSMVRQEGDIILQGSEVGRGWSVIISEQTGKFSATISEDDFGFIIFGSCMAI